MRGGSAHRRDPGAATKRELFGWAMYDFANSGYTTVVLTAVFNAYYVEVVAGGVAGLRPGAATLFWTLAIGVANGIVLLTAPLLGAVADHLAIKKLVLGFTTVACVISTALLALVGPGDIVLGTTLVIFSAVMFSSGENLIAAFLPEIAPAGRMGRVSGYGWSLGYIGGLLTLSLCLVYMQWAKVQGSDATQFVPASMLIVAVVFALAATPTFLFVRERAQPSPLDSGLSYLRAGYHRLRRTVAEAARFQDLARFLVVLSIYQSGVATVVVLAAVYAQQVLGFTTADLLVLIIVVNVTAAVGAFLCGYLQDRFGSLRALTVGLSVWVLAVWLAYNASSPGHLWLAGNLMGLAMGSTQSAGRALIGQFAPPERAAEFFGLWGLAGKLAAILGPVSYGVITYLTHGDHRRGILSTLLFFVVGLFALLLVDEQRGRAAAHE